MKTDSCNILHKHSRDALISFEESEHVYTHQQLGRFDSWTETISSYFNPFDTDSVAASVAQKEGIQKEEVIARWEHQTELGTQLHANIERFLLGDTYSASDVFFMFQEFYREHPVVPYRTE